MCSSDLHQTVYFLRREIEPGYRDGHSTDYLHVESELVYFDPELVHTASGAFLRQASQSLSRGTSGPEAVSLLASYPGPFALDFQYEDWTSAWRDTTHRTYLRLAEAALTEMIGAGEADRAIGVIAAVLTVDPEAIEIEALLPKALARAGSRTAAEAAYLRYAARFRTAFDAPAPPLGGMLDDP
mgnify:FL=1